MSHAARFTLGRAPTRSRKTRDTTCVTERPLNSIRLATSLLVNPNYNIAEPDRQVILAEMNTQVDYMLALLNDLLDVSHIELGKLNLHLQSIVLADFLSETVTRHAKLAAPKGIVVGLSHVADGRAQADPLRVRQVLDNLMSSAVKFRHPTAVSKFRHRHHRPNGASPSRITVLG